jgi:hypothetical protein
VEPPSGKDDKTNRVDLLAEADDKELVVVELQYFGEDKYFHIFDAVTLTNNF